MWFKEGKWRDLFFPRAEGLTETDSTRWITVPTSSSFISTNCVQWWTWAKFKHAVPDSSSQQLHYPWCAQALGEEPAKCCTFNFLNSPSSSAHHPCTHMFFLILLFTLAHSWLSHLCPKNRNLKLLVVPTINLVIFHPLLYLLPLTHTHTYRCFLLAGCWGT